MHGKPSARVMNGPFAFTKYYIAMNIYIKSLVLSALLCANYICLSQTLYANNSGEKVFIGSLDSVYLKIKNNDAFDTFFIGIGRIKRNKSVVLFKSNNLIGNYTASLHKTQTNDTMIAMKLLYHDSTPMGLCSVRLISLSNNKTLFRGIINDSGIVILDKSLTKQYNNQNYWLEIKTLGFYTQKQIVFKQGTMYTIVSNMNYSFFSSQSKAKIKVVVENDSIKLSYSYNNNHTILKAQPISKDGFSLQYFLEH
jgi:hypothetical protein